MGNIVSGLEIANKRIKEKEELTGLIFFWLTLEIAEIIELFKLVGYEPTPYEKQEFLIKAHIIAEKKAEIILKNKRD